MTDEKKYVDPNSGAAPQPGGYAGVEAAAKGFAVPADAELEEEFSPSEYEAPGGTGTAGGGYSVDEVAKAAEKAAEKRDSKEKSEEEQQRLEALANPRKVLADLDESGNVEAPDAGAEEEAVNAAALEHQAVDLENAAEEGGSYDPSQYSVEDVNAYLAENPDQKDAVVAAEKDGKNRKGITG
jgi:hypothetical protein